MGTSQQQTPPHDGADSHQELFSAPSYLTSWRPSADLPLAEPRCWSPRIIASWFDGPNLGGTGPSGQAHKTIDLSSFHLPLQSTGSMAGPPTYRTHGFDYGSVSTPVSNRWLNSPNITHTSPHQQQRNTGPRFPTSNHSPDNFGASRLFNSRGYTDPASLMGPVHQERSSIVPGNTQRTIPPFGAEEVGGE